MLKHGVLSDFYTTLLVEGISKTGFSVHRLKVKVQV